MKDAVTPFPPYRISELTSQLQEENISRRAALRAGLRLIAGGTVAGGVLPLLGGCQGGGGWEPLAEDDPSLNGPLNRAPMGRQGRSVGGGSQSLTQRPGNVIARTQWTSKRTIASEANAMVRVNSITVHHDGMPPVTLRSRSAVAARLEQIRSSHVNGRGWADIGYHYVVDPMGNVWEARPLVYQGAHVKDHNPRNMGVMVLGNFEEQTPTRAALNSLDGFLMSQMDRYSVPTSRVVTHQELAPTACPGRSLQRHMESVRSGSGRLA